jgi:hypothetical protein
MPLQGRRFIREQLVPHQTARGWLTRDSLRPEWAMESAAPSPARAPCLLIGSQPPPRGRMLLRGSARLIMSEAGQGIRQVVANAALRTAANGGRAVAFAGSDAACEVLQSTNGTAALAASEGSNFSLWDLVPGVSTGKAIVNLVKCYRGG